MGKGAEGHSCSFISAQLLGQPYFVQIHLPLLDSWSKGESSPARGTASSGMTLRMGSGQSTRQPGLGPGTATSDLGNGASFTSLSVTWRSPRVGFAPVPTETMERCVWKTADTCEGFVFQSLARSRGSFLDHQHPLPWELMSNAETQAPPRSLGCNFSKIPRRGGFKCTPGPSGSWLST